MQEIPTKNTGVIIEPPKPKDWIFGAATSIPFEERLADGNWKKYQPTKELQFSFGKYDTMSCVTFSGLNSFEMQVNWMLKNGKIPDDVVKKLRDMGFFDANDQFNCSDWFTAVMSGTTPNGNTLNAVWESIRVHGVLPQSKGLKPEDVQNIQEWLDPTKITQEHKDLALQSLEIFKTNYEWTLLGVSNPSVINKQLQHAPIHIATAVCAGWGVDTPIKTCVQPIQHATCADYSELNKVTHILDHYDPIEKQLAWDYQIPYAIKGVVALKDASQPDNNNMILPDAKKVLFINAGHHDTDAGAVNGDIVERDECKKVRDALKVLLGKRNEYTVHWVPDNLDLNQSIAWVNAKASNINDGLAIDIHFNSLSDKSVGGTEAFHGTSDVSQKIAAALSLGVSKKLGLKNRGAKPDTQTAVGSLGWIRKTKMWASLIEICFITNVADMAVIKAPNGYQNAAQGLLDGIDQIFGIKPPVVTPEPPVQPPVEPPTTKPALDGYTSKELLEELLKRQK